METVYLDRLLEMAGFIWSDGFSWENSGKITMKDIYKEMNRGLDGIDIPYPVKKDRNRKYHIRRIIYFMSHAQEIIGIEVCNPCVDYYEILPAVLIIDGWHRIAAAMAIRKETVCIEYEGRQDVLDYMKGECDFPPNDFL